MGERNLTYSDFAACVLVNRFPGERATSAFTSQSELSSSLVRANEISSPKSWMNLKFFHEEHLVNVVTSQAVRGGHQHSVKGGITDVITQTIEPWTAQTRSAVAIVTENVFLIPFPSLFLTVFTQ